MGHNHRHRLNHQRTHHHHQAIEEEVDEEEVDEEEVGEEEEEDGVAMTPTLCDANIHIPLVSIFAKACLGDPLPRWQIPLTTVCG
jgi:hypothetical protein